MTDEYLIASEIREIKNLLILKEQYTSAERLLNGIKEVYVKNDFKRLRINFLDNTSISITKEECKKISYSNLNGDILKIVYARIDFLTETRHKEIKLIPIRSIKDITFEDIE